MIPLNIPSAKRVLASIVVAGLLFSAPVLAQEAPSESDDTPQAVPVLYDPSQEVLTNREAAVLLADALGLAEQSWQGLFADVGSDSDHVGSIEALALAGVLQGSLGGVFNPDETITRGEFAVWIDRGFADGFDPEPAPFTDVPEGAPYESAVQRLYAAGITAAAPRIRSCSAGKLI